MTQCLFSLTGLSFLSLKVNKTKKIAAGCRETGKFSVLKTFMAENLKEQLNFWLVQSIATGFDYSAVLWYKWIMY